MDLNKEENPVKFKGEIPIALKEKTTFKVSSIDDVKSLLPQMKACLEEYSFVRITGLIDKEKILSAKKKIDQHFNFMEDRASIGEDPKEIQRNFRKLSIGGAQQFGVYRPRCLRTIYNPLWDEDIFELHESFKTMAKVRNLFYGFQENFAIDGVEDDMWTASRIHHYPTGGGFLISHRDTVVPKVHKKQGYSGFHQLIMVLSKKGIDYQDGGGFATLGGKQYFYEAEAEYGDIAIYDGATVHGVADIDPELPFDQKSSSGRMVAFVTLYKDIDKGYKI